MMTTNWQNFLKNLGEWQGSFTQVSLAGQILKSTPSILTLTQLESDRVHLRLRRFSDGDYHQPPSSDYQQEFRSLPRELVFFETGAFAQGALQLSGISTFGAEFCFVARDRRSRFVQLYDRQGNLSSLTLIREVRSGTDATEQPQLTIDRLLGTWEGVATTIYADGSEVKAQTRLQIDRLEEHQLQQQLTIGDNISNSIFNIDGDCRLVDTDASANQILLLPDGVSSHTPLKVSADRSCALEVGWLVADKERQRLTRNYNDRGEWVSATHTIERKIDSYNALR
jgi:hypothetical protein